MNRADNIGEVVLGGEISLRHLIAVARHGAKVSFDENFKKRVRECRERVEKFVAENRRIYGVTTGLGENVKRVVLESEAMDYQTKMLLTHCTTVGKTLDEEATRAVMFVMLANMGTGYSGARLSLLERLADLLNARVTPWAPAHGSVGYLGVEAHIALVLLGRGKAFYGDSGKLLDGGEALALAGLAPVQLSYKEGLCLISGGTSATALAALAEYDALNALSSADAVASLTLEALIGNTEAFDERVMSVKRQPHQWRTAEHLRKMLADSAILSGARKENLQDALSLRCIPQAHGAARKTILDAKTAIEDELNSCDDNPIIHPSGEAISACNADAGFVGIASDSLCVATCYLAKISERRTDRMINEHVSGLPAFLTTSAGANSGFMIVQYSSAGLLGEMRMLAHPATVDAVPTCAMQEDYVSMGYNAALKARDVVRLLEYVLGNELLTAAQALELRERKDLAPSATGRALCEAVRKRAPFMTEDHYVSPDMEWGRELIHSGRVRALAEEMIGLMD
ncbi:MAG: aromatic amino acid ammonia-lyase [Synergistaceae bacterium]|jgi:histidine ammonia-lyase|nr:aromatic amino acid ammonia-lyase [Synergistaceae bacterium]